MRLEALTIGGPEDVPSHKFKNLKNVTIKFDPSHWITVGIGWNGSGKSNILEALAIIFRELISAKTPKVDFVFRLVYRIGSGGDERRVSVEHDPARENDKFKFNVNSLAETLGEKNASGGSSVTETLLQRLTLAAFRRDNKNLPRYVFSYYSGENTRLQEVFLPYLEKYDSDLRSGKDPGLKRLFYAMPEHSQFVLLAFLIHQDPKVKHFLYEQLGINPDTGIESVLFVLRQPPWTSASPDGDPRFWNARGLVQKFLDRLQEVSLGPIERETLVSVSPWNKKRLKFKYLYLRDMEALRELVGGGSAGEFFRDLESTHVSQLIEEVRIRVRLGSGEESVTFRELSEGEQQLLTVLGLLLFTAEEESLFLLDEPDTHLNPRWSVDYLSYLELFLGAEDGMEQSCHVLMTTHNPISIAGLEKEQVQVLIRNASGDTQIQNPAVSPRGMGYSGVVTSDMFGLGTSLDKDTSADLIKLHKLANSPELSDRERKELGILRKELEKLDFNFASRDRLEQEFRRARFDLTSDMAGPVVSPENKKKALEVLVESLIRKGSDGSKGDEK
jgi:ABC-type transport system involved in cytochrome c biogenesis ATPase subunit